ncbi:peptide ABC transporter substrate-binding protein [Sphaerisporangium rufum]|uniref:Peptide ABC transporter substrate-binding protein n=1 Tax=Sphaerisporangium rufum TaxID=1381558 RepID=A0A919V5Q2_9ACTN|nr:ABC transporter substrate-binding protein [Sphaerisporangium rufum]GII78540.1 peptide ABC transporter substrate-binding protein [Sphaerisporangium rufum]
MRSLRRRTRQARLPAVLLSISVVAMSACSNSTATPDAAQTTGSNAGGNVLRVVVPAEPATFNPVLTLYSTLRIVGPVFDPLVGFDKESLEPNDSGLLTSWERVSPTEWRFKVRQGVKFHNGEAWDANAAAFTIEKYRDEPKSGFAPYYKRVEEVKAESADSLLITTKVPYIAMPKVLTTAMGVPPKYYAEVTGDRFGSAPVGTGPFQFDSLASGQSFSVKAYPGYWRGAPKLGGIRYSWAADASTRAALLQSGGADLVADLPNETIPQIENGAGTSVLSAPSLYKMALSMNANAGTLKDHDLRKAVQAAIDYDSIVKTLFGGVGARKSPYFIGDLLPQQPAVTYQKFDPARAKELVRAAGGTPKIRFLYTTGFYPKDKQVGEAVSAMLQDAGFQVEQVPLENAALRTERNTGNYSMYMVQNFPVFAHPDSFIAFFTGNNAAVKYCNDPDGYDALTEKALSATDQGASDEVYDQVEKKILDEDACNAILYDQVVSYGMTDKVKGLKPALDAVPSMYEVTLG